MLRLMDRQVLVDIADAIRHCNESDERYRPSEMAAAIRDLAMFGTPIPVYGLFDIDIDADVVAKSRPQVGDALAVSDFAFQNMYDITATASLR